VPFPFVPKAKVQISAFEILADRACPEQSRRECPRHTVHRHFAG
jgi:uncharacterized membrane protein YdbT with pleckstrin-like domain